MMMKIDPVYQTGSTDCGKACLTMLLNYHKKNLKGLDALANSLDGVQVRTIESYLREKGFQVISGNFNYAFLCHFITRKTPVICLLDDHYVLVKGVEHYKVIFNCPVLGEKKISATHFRRCWFNDSDGACLLNWAIAAYD